MIMGLFVFQFYISSITLISSTINYSSVKDVVNNHASTLT